MLALETGWTPDVIAELPRLFRAACHWTIYARTLAGPDGFPNTSIPQGAPPDMIREALTIRKAVDAQRELLFPVGD